MTSVLVMLICCFGMVIAALYKQDIPLVQDGISRVPLYALLDTQKLKQDIKSELEKEMTAKVKEILKGIVDSQISENLATINSNLSNIREGSNNQQDEIELLKLKGTFNITSDYKWLFIMLYFWLDTFYVISNKNVNITFGAHDVFWNNIFHVCLFVFCFIFNLVIRAGCSTVATCGPQQLIIPVYQTSTPVCFLASMLFHR